MSNNITANVPQVWNRFFNGIETLKFKIMNTERIKEIQKETGYPNSVSVQQALLKVWNECEQEQQLKNCNLQNVNARTLGFASCATLAKSMPLDQAIQVIKSDITGLPQTAVIDGELVVQYVR